MEGKAGFQDARIFDEVGSQKVGKSDVQDSASASPLCPECGSQKLYRDGLRPLADGSKVQRWLCRSCSYRFSEKPPQKNSKWSINTQCTLTSKRRICAKEAKNLTQATENKTVAGDLERLPQDAKGLITKYMAYLEREGYSEGIGYPATLKHLVKDGANLLDPENVKTVIAQHKWKNSVKMLATYAYDAFCKMEGIQWNMPTYHQEETTLYIHDEKDLDMLISAAVTSRRMAAFLQCLKETFADPGEILRLEWIDLKDNVLSINHPVKGHLTGKYQISTRLVSMLTSLPRKDKRIFPMTYGTAEDYLKKLRKRAAAKFQNPNLLTISFKSYRHWGGSMLAHVTNGNMLTIKKMLRHKSIQNTMKYIHTINFKEEDYDETVATTPEEVRQLGKAGWTKYDEMTIGGAQMHFYRKPKRFGGLNTSL